MKSFRDPDTNVLRSWGYVESSGSDIGRDEPDVFDLEPGEWRLVDDAWIPYIDTNSIIRAQIMAIEDATGVSSPVRQALLAMGVFVAQQTADQMTQAGTPTTADELLAQNIQYQATLAVDNQIKALEAQLT